MLFVTFYLLIYPFYKQTYRIILYCVQTFFFFTISFSDIILIAVKVLIGFSICHRIRISSSAFSLKNSTGSREAATYRNIEISPANMKDSSEQKRLHFPLLSLYTHNRLLPIYHMSIKTLFFRKPTCFVRGDFLRSIRFVSSS